MVIIDWQVPKSVSTVPSLAVRALQMSLEINIEFVDEVTDLSEYAEMLADYYGQMAEVLMNVGGPSFAVDLLVAETIEKLPEFLPPNGALAMARERDGLLMGCGSLRMLDADRVELKRLYVRDVARGMGIGRQLVALRIEKARELGAKTVLTDTVRGNTTLLKMYDSFGFRQISRYEGNADDPAMDPFLVYRQLDLEKGTAFEV